jgi:3-phosphoinositide dependent protein kinase-1
MSYSSRLTASTPVFAIKIIDQAHLIAERKVKYAHIERDALVRLSARPPNHTRGSSYGSVRPKNNRKSTASLGSVVAQVQVGGEHARRGSSSTLNNRMSVATNGSDSSATMSIPSIALNSNGTQQHRRGASQPDTASTIEEHGMEEKMESLKLAGDNASIDERRPRERSPLPVSGPSAYNTPQPSAKGRASHPGIVRLHQTFADKTSLCKCYHQAQQLTSRLCS